jgi:phosphatidylserine synthase 2
MNILRGKIMRVLGQFTPHDWLEFDWRPTASLKRWLGVLFLICFLFLIELGTFYLKFILWIPSSHFFCISRLLFFLLVGSVSIRQIFEYLDNPQCTKYGRQSWVLTAIVITEVLIVCKFDWETFMKSLPFHIVLVWTSITIGIVVWTIYQFWFKTFILWKQKKNVQIT